MDNIDNINNALYFERSNGERVVVGYPKTIKELNNMMTEYIHKLNHNFKIYYIRTMLDKKEICFDVGSHTEFFYISTAAYKDMKGEENE